MYLMKPKNSITTLVFSQKTNKIVNKETFKHKSNNTSEHIKMENIRFG